MIRNLAQRFREWVRRYLVPSEENGYMPHVLQKTAAGGILLLILLTFTLTNIQAITLLTSTWLSSAILPSVLVDLTNDNRTSDSLGALSRSATLDEAARMKAEDMAKYEYFAHESPSGVTPWYWFEKAGYVYTHAGENLAVHFTDSDDVVSAWMKSPGHRANILNAHYTEIGIGTAKGEYKGAPTIFVVQLFGRPMTEDEKARVAFAEASKTPVAILAEAPPQKPASKTPISTNVAGAEKETPAPPNSINTPALPSVTTSTGTVSLPSTTTPDLVASAEPTERPTTYVLSEVATTSPFVSRGVISIPIGTTGGNTAVVRASSFFGALAVRPHFLLTMVYVLLSLFILSILGISIAVEWRRHHPVQVFYGAGLVAVMWVAFYIHTALLGGALIT